MSASKKDPRCAVCSPVHAQVFPLQDCQPENANPGVWAFVSQLRIITTVSTVEGSYAVTVLFNVWLVLLHLLTAKRGV
jgi:hypothetical protein